MFNNLSKRSQLRGERMRLRSRTAVESLRDSGDLSRTEAARWRPMVRRHGLHLRGEGTENEEQQLDRCESSRTSINLNYIWRMLGHYTVCVCVSFGNEYEDRLHLVLTVVHFSFVQCSSSFVLESILLSTRPTITRISYITPRFVHDSTGRYFIAFIILIEIFNGTGICNLMFSYLCIRVSVFSVP